MSCEYCSKRTFIDGNDSIFGRISADLWMDGNRLKMEVSKEGQKLFTTHILIKYCPMCGDKVKSPNVSVIVER